ncbi:PTS transporter subunit IIC [Alteribacter natronophilus]|uniref:PTS transporter subunit IIC n=1 Tax=Alteribacter natronophilus TaxID=2583810 RepID=UPI00110D990C|nr:PTS sugar transporter subunit IIC [Alteribacter natronophilus]TMW71763.1 PTS sugar transporter subunit IIC [Alteribacter natronophilus]
MTSFFRKKGVQPSFKTYVIDALSFMALGLFSSLIIGLILQTAGNQLLAAGAGGVIDRFAGWLAGTGELAMSLMGPAIGVAVAYGLKAPRLVIFSAVITGAAGADLGGPAGAFVAALLSVEAGKLISQETKIDIIVTPLVTIVTGVAAAAFIGPGIQTALEQFGAMIMWATDQQPFIMGILVAVMMGLALTAPISSAAIAIMLGLSGVAAGAAAVGCAAQMIGFAVSSYRENRWSGLVALGIGTSMLQIGNVVKNPWILLPPTAAAAILGPVSTVVFRMENLPAGAGMGTSGFVGQIMAFEAMGFTMNVLLIVLFMHFIGPAVLSLLLSEWLRKQGKIAFGDMKINQS